MPNKHNLTAPAATEPLDIAIDEDAYEYLEANAGYYLTAIEQALASGMTPTEIRAYIMRKAPDGPAWRTDASKPPRTCSARMADGWTIHRNGHARTEPSR